MAAALPLTVTLERERERAGAVRRRRTHLPVLVTVGDFGAVALASLMPTTLSVDFNVPIRWIEPVVTDTYENAIRSAAILRREGIPSIPVVTHAWPMRPTLVDFAQNGLTVTLAPVQMDNPRSPHWPILAPASVRGPTVITPYPHGSAS